MTPKKVSNSKRLTIEMRLLNRTKEDEAISSPHVDTPCWICSASKRLHGGAPILKIKGRKISVSRIAFFLWRGVIAEGLLVCHKCDNPSCVNPEHLWLGTHKENMKDMTDKGRAATGTRSGAYTHPEKLVRGDRHWTRTSPEKLARGDSHWARRIPEKLADQKGEKNPSAKLSEQKVKVIRSYKNQGCRLRDISAFMNIPYSTICEAARGASWKHVT